MEQFHSDNRQFFNIAGLEQAGDTEIMSSSLIRRCVSGDPAAARALHRGFWGFVYPFEDAIDTRIRTEFPMRQLVEKFGRTKVRGTLTSAVSHLRQMKQDEGEHREHWRDDAQNLGIELGNETVVPGIAALNAEIFASEHERAFYLLAGTEIIAEALARGLAEAPKFTRLFERKRWKWGDIHADDSHVGPSHLEIDLDFLRAISPKETAALQLENGVRRAVALFGVAADDVERHYCPLPAMAAE